jgi:phospholipase C
MTDLSLIDTIVIVMLENRSFDHMLGHLSLDPYANGSAIEGLKEPLNRLEYENVADGEPYYPFPMRDGRLSTDLPHSRAEMNRALALSPATGKYSMSGFVEVYFDHGGTNRTTTPDPMGFLTPEDLPVTDFFANNYAVCDHWFAPLPTSTQPNRLMALSGSSRIDETRGIFPPQDPLLIDWLFDRKVRWRVYHSGISFFALLGRGDIFTDRFRSIDRLAPDVSHELPGDFPSVILVEPAYGDAPRIGGSLPNDNHPPLPVAPGEALLQQIYEALTCNPERWARTVLIVTYDEHGGFFDHVPPIPIRYDPAPNAVFREPFLSTGLRVPSLVVSPLVSPMSVFGGTLDHTSILQLLAEKFAPNRGGYSESVENRRRQGIRSVSEVLDLAAPRTSIPKAPAATLRAQVSLGGPLPTGATDMQLAFAAAANSMVQNYPKETAQRYPEVSHWVLTQKDVG